MNDRRQQLTDTILSTLNAAVELDPDDRAALADQLAATVIASTSAWTQPPPQTRRRHAETSMTAALVMGWAAVGFSVMAGIAGSALLFLVSLTCFVGFVYRPIVTLFGMWFDHPIQEHTLHIPPPNTFATPKSPHDFVGSNTVIPDVKIGSRIGDMKVVHISVDMEETTRVSLVLKPDFFTYMPGARRDMSHGGHS